MSAAPDARRPPALGIAIAGVGHWRAALVLVKPDTVIAWHRLGLRLFWTWKSVVAWVDRPCRLDVRTLIRTMWDANPLWGAPRIHGELRRLGLDIGQASVAKYMVRRSPATVVDLSGPGCAGC